MLHCKNEREIISKVLTSFLFFSQFLHNMARLTARKLASQPHDELAGLYRATRTTHNTLKLERRQKRLAKPHAIR